MAKRSFVAALLDVTRDCSPHLVERCGGKVYQSAFFDENSATYCCSLTPSYDLDYLELVPEVVPDEEDARDSLSEDLLEASTEGDLGGYMTVYHVKALREKNPERFIKVNLDFDESDFDGMSEDEKYRAVREQVREALQSNPVF